MQLGKIHKVNFPMEFSKYLDPKMDIVFRRLFGRECNKIILINFLNAIGEFDVTDINYLNPVQEHEYPKMKTSIVDIACEDQKKRIFIIEMQVAFFKGFEKRIQYYASKAYQNQAMQGFKYRNLKPVIFIAITNYALFRDLSEYISVQKFYDTTNNYSCLNDITFILIDLSRFKVINESNFTEQQLWCYFLKCGSNIKEEEIKKIFKNNEIILKAFSEINKYNWTVKDYFIYEQELKNSRDYEALREHEIAEAKAEAKAEAEAKVAEIAKNFLKNGVPLNVISECTGLCVSDIKLLY